MSETLTQATPENALSAQHAQWLSHPVTRQMIKNLDKYREHYVLTMASRAFAADVQSEYIRVIAGGVATVTTIKTMITKTEEFINQSNKE